MSRPHPADHPFVEDPKDRDRCGYCSWDRSMQPPAPKVGSPEQPTDKERIQAALEIIHTHQDDDQRSVGPETTIRMLRELLEGEWGDAESEGGEVTPKPRELSLTMQEGGGFICSLSLTNLPPGFYLFRQVLNGEAPEPTNLDPYRKENKPQTNFKGGEPPAKGIDFSAMARMPRLDPDVTCFLPYDEKMTICRYCHGRRVEDHDDGICRIKGCTLNGPPEPQEGGEA